MNNNKPYIIYNDEVLQKKKRKNSYLLLSVYIIFFAICGVLFYIYGTNKAYLYNNELMLKKDNINNDMLESTSENIQQSDSVSIVSEDNKIVEEIKQPVVESQIKEKTTKTKETVVKIDSISLVQNISIKKGSKLKLVPIITPANALVGSLEWYTSNSNVFVDNNGEITANYAGESIVTVRTENGKTASCRVIVLETDIKVSDISLNISNVNMSIGEQKQLVATINPISATNKNITWTSSDSSIVTVENGIIKGINLGTAIITAKTTNGKVATCKVVINPVNETGISLNTNKIVLKENDTYQLIGTISPSNATNKSVTWTSSDSKVVSVSNGKITAKTIGSATITAKTTNGKIATCLVTVNKKIIDVTSISLNITNKVLYVGETVTVNATINPTNASDKTINWTTSNKNIATVENGKVKALGVGTATITAKANNGKLATCQIVVKKIDVQSISLNKNKVVLEENEEYQLTSTISPSNATDKTVTWTTSNKNVATVANGKIKAVGLGTATITAKTSNNKIETCFVIVEGNTYKLTLDSQKGKTSGTKEVWFQYKTSRTMEGETVYYYINSQLTKKLPNSQIENPTKDNYTFGGYYTKVNGQGSQYVNDKGKFVNDAYKNIKANTTLYAKWVPVQYTLTFDVNGGTAWTSTTCSNSWSLQNNVCSKKVDYGTTYKTFPTPEKNGYTFDGWWTEKTNGTKVTELNINSNKTLYAHWKVKDESIKFVYYYQLSYTKTNFCGTNRTLAQAGCGVTSAAMVATSLTGDSKYNPVYMMNLAKKGKYCGPGLTGTSVSFMKYFSKQLGFNYQTMTKGEKNKVLKALRSGKSLVIAHMGPGTFTDKGHYIVLSKADSGKNVYVNDPANKKNNHYWSIDKIAKELKYYGSFHVITKK